MIALWLALSGCVSGRVTYGDVEVLPLVHPANDRKRWYVIVDTGDHGEHLFFFDTGYSVTTCDDSFAEALQLEGKGTIRVRGEAGVLLATRARLPTFEVGGHTVERFECLVRDLDSTSSIRDPREVPVAGVIGADLLMHFRADVDPSTGQVTLSEPGEPFDKSDPYVVRMPRETPFGPRRVLPTELAGQRIRPVIDTGATGTHLDGERLGLEPVRIKEGAVIRGSGGDGHIIRDIRFYEEEVRIGQHVLPDVSITGRASGSWDDGLLGINVLGQFRQEYDWKRGWVRLVPIEGSEVKSWRHWQRGVERDD